MFDNVLRVVFVVWMGLLRSLLTHNITEHVSVSLSSAYLSTWNASYILFWVHLAAAYPIFYMLCCVFCTYIDTWVTWNASYILLEANYNKENTFKVQFRCFLTIFTQQSHV